MGVFDALSEMNDEELDLCGSFLADFSLTNVRAPGGGRVCACAGGRLRTAWAGPLCGSHGFARCGTWRGFTQALVIVSAVVIVFVNAVLRYLLKGTAPPPIVLHCQAFTLMHTPHGFSPRCGTPLGAHQLSRGSSGMTRCRQSPSQRHSRSVLPLHRPPLHDCLHALTCCDMRCGHWCRRVYHQIFLAQFINTAIIALLVNTKAPDLVVIPGLGLFEGQFDDFTPSWYAHRGDGAHQRVGVRGGGV